MQTTPGDDPQNPYEVNSLKVHHHDPHIKHPTLIKTIAMLAWTAIGTYCPIQQLDWVMEWEPFIVFDWTKAIYSSQGILLAFGWAFWSYCIIRYVANERNRYFFLLALILPAIFLPMSIIATYAYFSDVLHLPWPQSN